MMLSDVASRHSSPSTISRRHLRRHTSTRSARRTISTERRRPQEDSASSTWRTSGSSRPRVPARSVSSSSQLADRGGLRVLEQRPRDRLPPHARRSPTTSAPPSTSRAWSSATWATTAAPASPSPAIRPPARTHIFGEYLMNAQGEDVVAGVRTPCRSTELAKQNPDDLPAVHRHLQHALRATTRTCRTSSSPSSTTGCSCCSAAAASAPARRRQDRRRHGERGPDHKGGSRSHRVTGAQLDQLPAPAHRSGRDRSGNAACKGLAASRARRRQSRLRRGHRGRTAATRRRRARRSSWCATRRTRTTSTACWRRRASSRRAAARPPTRRSLPAASASLRRGR